MKKAAVLLFALLLVLSSVPPAAEAADYTVRGFKAADAVLSAFPKGEDPYTASGEVLDRSAAAFAKLLEESDLYFILDYEMEAAERPTRAPLVLTLRFPTGGRYTYRTNVTFAKGAKEAGKGFLAIPFGQLMRGHGRLPMGEYTVLVEIAGKTAGKAFFSLLGAAAAGSSIPEHRRAISDFTVEILSPTRVEIAWPGSADNVSIVNEQENNRHFNTIEAVQNPAVLEDLLPGRTYRIAIGEDVERIRELFFENDKYFVDITMPRCGTFAPEGFSIVEVVPLHSTDDFQYNSKTLDFFPLSAIKGTGGGVYAVGVKFKADNPDALPKTARVLWGLTSPSGADYFAAADTDFLNSPTFTLLLDSVLPAIAKYDSAPEAGTYLFSLYVNDELMVTKDIEIK